MVCEGRAEKIDNYIRVQIARSQWDYSIFNIRECYKVYAMGGGSERRWEGQVNRGSKYLAAYPNMITKHN